MQKDKEIYVVAGATGNVGSKVAKSLLKHGKCVRVLLRTEDPSKRKLWEDLGAEIYIASFDDEAALIKSYKGASKVFVMNPPLFQLSDAFSANVEMINAMTNALQKSPTITNIVMLSSIGADITDKKISGAVYLCHLLEKSLFTAFSKTNSPTITAVRAPFFLENWTAPHSLDAVFGAKKLFSTLQPVDRKFPMASTLDIADTIVAQLLTDQPPLNGPKNRVVQMSDNANASPVDVADALSLLIGQKSGNHTEKVEAVPVERKIWETMLGGENFERMSEPNAKLLTALYDGINSGAFAYEKGEKSGNEGLYEYKLVPARVKFSVREALDMDEAVKIRLGKL